MAELELSAGESIYYEYDPPGAKGVTFVFVNALTGSTDAWEAKVAPALRAGGFGTLS